MTSIFFQDRNKHADNEIKSQKKIFLPVKNTHFTLISGWQYFSPRVIDLPNISMIIAFDNKSIDLRNNFNNLSLILQDASIRLSDLLFYSPSLSGFADCILVDDAEYLVIPGMRSCLNIYHASVSTAETQSQRKLKTFLSSLFFDTSPMHGWNLIPKFSILSSSDKGHVIKRFPRFYTDSSNPSFFDQHIPKSTPRFRESTEHVRLLLCSYFKNKNFQKFKSLDLTLPRVLPSNFDDKCAVLREWLTEVHTVTLISYDHLIFYLLLSHPDFLDCLLDLYLNALSPKAAQNPCYRNKILIDWHLQSLASILTPYLSPLIASICIEKMSLDDLEASNFELAVLKLMRT